MGLKFSLKSALMGIVGVIAVIQPAFSECPSNIQDKASKITGVLKALRLNDPNSGERISYSSAVIIAKTGITYYVLTNAHNIDPESPVSSTFSGRLYELTLVDIDKKYDIAVMRFESPDLIDTGSIMLADTSKLNDRSDLYISGISLARDSFLCLSAKSTGIIAKSQGAEGARLTYEIAKSNIRFVNGMSGGSVLDQNQNLLGIQSQQQQLIPLLNFNNLKKLPSVVKAELDKILSNPIAISKAPSITIEASPKISPTLPPSSVPIAIRLPDKPKPTSSIFYWDCERCLLSRTNLPFVIELAAKSSIDNLKNTPVVSNARLITPFLNATNLSKANLANSYLWNAQLMFADLQGADLSNSTLDNSVITFANLNGSNLKNSDLRNVNLSNTNLSTSDMTGTNLSDANLVYTNLSGANLSGANLRRAKLYRANLSGANLTGADLYGADLQGANLTGAILKNAQFCRTIMPDGTKSQEGC